MSKSQRDKGNRFEREVVNYLKEKGFHDAKRIPLSGSQQGFKGDLIIQRTEDSPSLLGECKCRASGFKLIYDSIEKDDANVLFIKHDRKETLVVMKIEDYVNGKF
ncbi:MAG: hypothetical protein VYE48_00240 [Pseudomonadota bacterium]|jgi:Holliday junction resolvase|nr:hypothetical protein [Pseudomonadota bacterium]|tara:strand:+ start:152 stop:466 length:315 start_codon:yes stop_codon:yes gene_type:complete